MGAILKGPAGRFAEAITQAGLDGSIGTMPEETRPLDLFSTASERLGLALDAVLSRDREQARQEVAAAGIVLALLHDALGREIAGATDDGTEPGGEE